MSRALAALALLVLGASPALAEVRIARQPDGLSLEIRHSKSLTWTPLGSPGRHRLLNPEGDRTADGRPTWTASGDRLVAAWRRGATGEIVLARVDAVGTTSTTLRAPSATDEIAVVMLPELTMVAWETTEAEVAVVACRDLACSEPVPVTRGALLGAAPLGDDRLATLAVDTVWGELVVDEVIGISHPHPIPIPIPTGRLRIPLSSPGSIGPLAEDRTPVQTCVAREEAGSLVVAWAVDRGTTAVVTIGPRGLEGPVERDGATGSCPAMLNAVRHSR